MKIVKKAWNYIITNPKGQLAPLVLILAAAGFFYFHNLGTDYITLWDEAVHVNVVKNLAQDPWPPKLHLTDIGIDFQDWTNNYVWVHKPLAPLYLQALFYKISSSLFAFRLPGAIFALMSVVALFFVARRHFSYGAAIIASGLFAFNSYVFELVKGRQFSGLHDLMFVFFGLLALDRILRIVNLSSRPKSRPFASKGQDERRDPLKLDTRYEILNTKDKGFLDLSSRPSDSLGMTEEKQCLLFGLFAGLGYLSKGGLALLFLPALFAAVVLQGESLRGARIPLVRVANLFYAVLVMMLLIFPEKIILLLLYPAEFYFEQSAQVLHLFKDLEFWGRPWDYYLTVYMRDLLLPYLYLPVVVGVVFGAFRSRADKRNLILVIWVLSFIVPLSFGITKISNFIFAAVPAMLILLALMFEWLWTQKKYAVMSSLSATAVLSYVIIRLDLWRVKYHLFQDQVAFQRFAILLYAGLFFAALWIIFRILEKYRSLEGLSKVFAVLSVFIILGTYARANQLSDIKTRGDYQYQQKVKDAGLSVKNLYPKDSIFLLNYPMLTKSHLYFKYWSGFDAMEIYDRQPIFILKKVLPKDREVFVLSNKPIGEGAGLSLVKEYEFGYLYR